METFYFNNDIVTDANGVAAYGLRSYGCVSNSSDGPIIEVIEHLGAKSDYFDPLFSLVFSPKPYSVKLYYCHYLGADYVELADYGEMFVDEYSSVKAPDEPSDSLVELYNKASIFLDGKISGLRNK